MSPNAGPAAKVLLVGDGPSALATIEAWLKPEGHQIVVVPSTTAGAGAFQQHRPDIIILDVWTNEADALALCKSVKGEHRLASYTPLVVVTAIADINHKIQWLEYGADIYLTKPLDPDELAATVAAAVRVKRVYDDLQQLTMIDGLTGLFNRRYCFQAVEYELKRARRYGHPLSILMLKVDRFKEITDQHGHPFGDFVLREIAGLLGAKKKDADILVRYGGDEFMLICVETAQEGAVTAAKRLQDMVAQHVMQQADRTAQVTVCVGVASLPSGEYRQEEALAPLAKALVTAAEAALSEAAQQGGNRVVARSPD